MKIVVMSDLHLEFASMPLMNTNNADTLILSGDIMVASELIKGSFSPWMYEDFIEMVCGEFRNVIYIMGNHEHYLGDINESVDIIKYFFQSHDNLYVLDNECVIIDDIKFLGTTMWANMDNGSPLTRQIVGDHMNDYKCIKNYGRRLWPDDTCDFFDESMEFLQRNLDTNRKNVVMTHHAPSFKSISESHRGDKLNGAYATELYDWISYLDSDVPLWTHGHIHDNSDYMIENTRVYCNPRGYSKTPQDVGADNINFKFDEIIEI